MEFAAAGPRVLIEGLPVWSGKLLSSDAAVFRSLRTLEECVRFASQLRGQFCIIVQVGADTFAITDFCCSRPIFYALDEKAKAYRVSQQQGELKDLASGKPGKAALYFYAARGGMGIDPFYEGVCEVYPATVMHFAGTEVRTANYIDWGRLLETKPVLPAEAEEQFLHIATEYLTAVLSRNTKVACLLSGGTDSALMAWLLRSTGKETIALTADYQWKRYSEYPEAKKLSDSLGLQQERVLVTRTGHRAAFRELNSGLQNAPCCHTQSPSLYQLAARAQEQGISALVTGDHADALFLGFDNQFRGLPQDFAEYERTVKNMSRAEVVRRLCGKPVVTPEQEELLVTLGYSVSEFRDWLENMYTSDCRQVESWDSEATLPLLQQLRGQIWAGISWQNIFLPVAQALPGAEFISPFYDIEMVKFALSLPLEYKFHNGLTKVLVRNILERVTGFRIVKRASPNPSRVWSLVPNRADRRLLSPVLRPLYDRVYIRNLLNKGKHHSYLEQISALGVWMGAS